jgi:toxin ParE1/3/4
MAEIAWTNEAKSWLQQIYDYIARDNEEAAWQVILGIYERVQILRDFPESGHRYQKYPDKDIRILLYGHYRIAYLIRDEKTIHILGVLHGALDIDEHLRRSGI